MAWKFPNIKRRPAMNIKSILTILITAGLLLSGCQATKEEKIAEITRVAAETQAADVTQIAAEVFATQTALAPTPSPHLAGDTQISPVDGMAMVYVPAGEAILGSDEGRMAWAYVACDLDYSVCSIEDYANEGPVHTLHLDAFWIDQTEVTNQRFSQFVVETGYKTNAEDWQFAYGMKNNKWQPLRNASWMRPTGEDSSKDLPEHPVVNVSWYDAQAYCEWAGRRLPTEAEWEKAAGGAEGFMFPWGDDPTFNLRGNFFFIDTEEPDGFRRTAPVGSFPEGASPYGVLDLSGNVNEWVYDGYVPYAEISTFTDNFVNLEAKNRVYRGGGFTAKSTHLRTAARYAADPIMGREDLGFRCVLSEVDLPVRHVPENFLPDAMLLTHATPYAVTSEGERLNLLGDPTGEKWEKPLEAGALNVVAQYNNCTSLKITSSARLDEPESWIHIDGYNLRDSVILYQPCSNFEKVLIRPFSGLVYPTFLNTAGEKDVRGRLQVTNNGKQDTYVALVDPEGAGSYGLYLWGGQTETLRGVKDGSYEVYITTGSQWDVTQGRFLNAGLYQKMDDVLKFTERIIWELELDVIEGGNTTGTRINPADFPPIPQ